MKKENMIFIYDSETSYINKEQFTLPKGKRKRYADSIYIRNINEEKGLLFNDGEETMSNFTNYILTLSKQYNKGTDKRRFNSPFVIVYYNQMELR